MLPAEIRTAIKQVRVTYSSSLGVYCKHVSYANEMNNDSIHGLLEEMASEPDLLIPSIVVRHASVW